MNYILLTSEKSAINELIPKNNFKVVIVEELGEEAKISDGHESESVNNHIANKLNQRVNNISDVIVIDFDMGNGQKAFNVLHHFRLYNKSRSNLVFITNEEPIKYSDEKYWDVEDFGAFKIGAARFISYSDLFDMELNPFTGKTMFEDLIARTKFDYEIYIEQLTIPLPKTTSRHQISNEWGSLRLLQNFGYKIDDVNYSYPPTLYFRFLLEKTKSLSFKNDVDSSLWGKFSRVLLIDDNSNKGWKFTLEKIFGCEVNAFEDTKIWTSQVITEGSDLFSGYDLVLLDLYMPNSENYVSNKRQLEVLKTLKSINKHVPVVIFTASNKTWNYKEVIKLGADGMYIKESPEYSFQDDYSQNNYLNFLTTFHGVSLKYEVLRPYCETIEGVLNSDKFDRISEKYYENHEGTMETSFSERLKERLWMFYGLLKSGFEQSEYNEEQFFLSDWELSYMTLWSALNEISEMNYVKNKTNSGSILPVNGNYKNKHPNGKIVELDDCWKLKSNDIVFLYYKHEFDGKKTYKGYYDIQSSVYSDFTIDRKNGAVIDNSSKPNVESISNQICFILNKDKDFQNLDVSNYLDVLLKSNKIRNQLYLTHGSKVETGFYDVTLKTVRDLKKNKINPKKELCDLFNLICFLLTADAQIKVVFD